MEVKAGYKKTGAGVVPDAWTVRPLAGMVEVLHGFGFQSRYFTPSGSYRLTTPGHFLESGGFREIGDKQKFYDGPVPDGYILEKGDLIVAMTEQADGLLGSAAHIPTDGVYLHNQRLGKVRVISRELSQRFLYWVFNTPWYRSGVRESAAGTKVKHTSPDRLLQIPVALPATLAEQEAIAAALSDADALIESLEQLIAKKRQIKQGAMQELLTGKRRLPGFDGSWNTIQIREVARTYSGGTPSSESACYYDGDIPWITSGDLNSRYVTEVSGRISESGLENSAAKIVEPSTLLLALYGATSGVVAVSMIRAAINQAVLAIVPTAANGRFLFFKLIYLKDWLISTYTQGGQPNLSGEIVNSVALTMPGSEEQAAIAEVLTTMDDEIVALESRLSKARALKQGMMQELLTGRIRLV